MFLASVIANFVFFFLLICVIVKPKFVHVIISVSYVIPYSFLIWYFILKDQPHAVGKPLVTIVLMLALALLALANYTRRKAKDQKGQAFSYVVFMFLYLSPILILLPYLTK